MSLNEVVLRPVELEAYGLLLRPWEETPGDLDAALRGLGDPDFRRWNTAHAPEPDEEGARGFLRRRRDGWAAGDLASFAVTEAGVVLGQTGIGMIDHAMRGARVSYWMLPEARGRGVATRALEAVTRWAFRDLGLHRLELGHAVGNEPSCGVARRCGYVLEGVLREAVVDLSGTLRDVHLHSRLATDPRS
ncbi:GNAT family protein [Actinacidiphila glaucinigra]|uniref:GNAT family N-acetyltransferase n=1 Tax=Actinacidiphila glaucinigra TaxID=235986 RepID=UPI002E35AE4B|nr:GNAT family protein [Actinacidiphila glaucinigra]